MHFENNQYYATLDSVKKGWYNLAVLQKNCSGAESASVGKIWFHWDGRIFFAYFSNIAKNKDDVVFALNDLIDNMNIDKLLETYSPLGSNSYSPKMMLKILM